MAYNPNWKIEDLLYLKSFKGGNSLLVRDAVDNYDSLSHFYNSSLPSKLSRVFNQDRLIVDYSSVDKEIIQKSVEICQKNNYKILTIWDSDYPQLLREISYPPLIVFVEGELYNHKPAVGIVGKRNCSDYGKHCAKEFSGYLAENEVVIISGLADGIDTYAHQAAIDAKGITYAVIASGLDKVLPASKNEMARRIIDSGGAIITEYTPGTKAIPPFFPQRNRIISGISKAVIVIESSERGGSLITAHFAFDEGRDVFAVPGNITSEKSIGTNLLIKKNMAAIAISPEIILEDLNLYEGKKEKNLFLFNKIEELLDTEIQKNIFDLISTEPTQIDELAFNSKLDMSELLVVLLELELKGLIRQLPGKYYVK